MSTRYREESEDARQRLANSVSPEGLRDPNSVHDSVFCSQGFFSRFLPLQRGAKPAAKLLRRVLSTPRSGRRAVAGAVLRVILMVCGRRGKFLRHVSLRTRSHSSAAQTIAHALKHTNVSADDFDLTSFVRDANCRGFQAKKPKINDANANGQNDRLWKRLDGINGREDGPLGNPFSQT